MAIAVMDTVTVTATVTATADIGYGVAARLSAPLAP